MEIMQEFIYVIIVEFLRNSILAQFLCIVSHVQNMQKHVNVAYIEFHKFSLVELIERDAHEQRQYIDI